MPESKHRFDNIARKLAVVAAGGLFVGGMFLVAAVQTGNSLIIGTAVICASLCLLSFCLGLLTLGGH